LTLLITLQESRSDKKPKIDYVGTLLLLLATVSFMLALEWGGRSYAWSSAQILSLFAVSIITAVLFVWVEKRVQEPILPLQLFRNRMVVSTSIVCLCQGVVLFSTITYLPIFAVAVLGQKNSNTLLTPLMFSLMVGAVTAGMLQAYFSFRTLMAVSMAAGIGTGYLLSTVAHDVSMGYMFLLMVLLGLGAVGPLMSVAQTAVASSVAPPYLGIVSSFVGFWRNIGGVLGASVMATIVNSQLRHFIEKEASSYHIPVNQMDTLANPELLLRASASLPKEMYDFLRDALGTAINHGFILSICFAAVGLIAAVLAGPGRARKTPAKP
jgi:MFS family permease